MANFSVTTNHYLRQLYSSNRDLASGSGRMKVSAESLAKADSKALSRGIASLSEFNYDEDVEESEKFARTLKAFADSYNQTIDSGGKLSDDPSSKKIMKDIDNLRKEHGDELASYGISFDDKGYMQLNDLALNTISVSNFKNVVGEDSEFMQSLSKLSTKLNRRINYLV